MLARMASDDAADLLLEIDQDRRLPILNLLPAAKQRKITGLLGYNPSTAGGLMNPDFVSVPADATVGAALARVRASELGPQQIAIVCVLDDAGDARSAALSLAELHPRRAAAGGRATLIDERRTDRPGRGRRARGGAADDRLQPGRDARSSTATASPSASIAVDDVLELLVPEEWRRRAGVARD